jgi:hypothetical protein
MIDKAEAPFFRASTLGRIGRYQLEGPFQSAHVRRRTSVGNWGAPVAAQFAKAVELHDLT